MSRKVFVLLCVLALFAGFVRLKELRTSSSTGAPPYGEALEDVPDDASDWITQWKRPEGPAKVALQVGHLQNEELADELADVAIYLLKLADKTKIDLKTAVENKLVKASKKYPVDAVKGNSKEYYKLKRQARAQRPL